MAPTTRSDAAEAPAVRVEVESLAPVAVPLRRSVDGALVADWGRIPARVYVTGLSGEGRRTMATCLGAIATWLSGGRADIDTLAWASLRFTHTAAVRAALARAVGEGRYAPATANKHLAVLRGAMKAAWRLGMVETEDYPGDLLDAGADLPAVQQLLGHASPAATALTRADIVGLASPPEAAGG